MNETLLMEEHSVCGQRMRDFSKLKIKEPNILNLASHKFIGPPSDINGA